MGLKTREALYFETFIIGTVTSTGRWKVSAKIQQLLNTLKRPKRRPLPEFYEDDDIELEIAANPKDPNAPKPEGATMTPAIGEQLVVCSDSNLQFIFIFFLTIERLNLVDVLQLLQKGLQF